MGNGSIGLSLVIFPINIFILRSWTHNGRGIAKLTFKMEMKSKKLPLKADARDYGIQKAVVLTFNCLTAKDMIILFMLLKEDLVDSIEILLDNFSLYLRKSNKDNKSVCSIFNIQKKTIKASISFNSLEFVIFFLLKYYRDEMGEVEHIDLDFEFNKDEIVTLTIKVDSFKGISAEEMNRLLGL
jgi:hypothetical protein